MSDLSGSASVSQSVRPVALDPRSEVSRPGGKPLPAQVQQPANAEALRSASLYTKAQEGRIGGTHAGPASSAEDLEQAVAKLNDYVQNTERTLNFQLDEEAGVTIIRVYEKNSQELIRQIPSEEAVTLAQKLNQEEPMMLFSAQV